MVNGYETFSAKDAKEGLEVAKREVPDLITLDLEMPGEWGPRFYRKMTQEKDKESKKGWVYLLLPSQSYLTTQS